MTDKTWPGKEIRLPDLLGENGLKQGVVVPMVVYDRLVKFCLDKCNGSFTLHINNGIITETMHINEVVRGKIKNDA